MLTLFSTLDRTVRLHGEEVAVVDPEGNFTWREFAGRAERAAGVLAGLGVGPGDRFGIIGRNAFRQAELIAGGQRIGAVPVPVNFRLAPPEMRFVLEDAACGVLAVEDHFADLLGTEDLGPWRERAFCLAPAPAEGLPCYEDLLAAATPAPAREAAEDDDAILFYTGGTTGRSKGVRLTHRNVVANGMQLVGQLRVRTSDVYLHVAPMFHSADLLATAFTLLGAGHAFLPQFTPEALLSRIGEAGVTAVMLTPTMIITTLQQCDPADYDLSSLRYLYYGSSPMAAEWVERAFSAFPGVDIEQGYGLTETSPILTTLDVEEHRAALAAGEIGRLRGAGRPVIGVDMRIVDDAGREVPAGESGEIVVRGPNVTPGYLNRPEESRRAFRDGWFHTGDVGTMDERGFLYVLDRKKDMIITGGENVYSSEVEAVLYQHPDVHEAAVVGVPDERYGEALFAVIVPAPGRTLTEEGLIAHCRERIGGYKIPRRMAFVDALPKSAMGKILKTELRRTYG